MAKKFDTVWIGTITGLITPIFTLFIFYLVKYNHLTFGQFYTDILLANNIITPVISLCVITNLLVFFIFIWTNRYYNARGVLLATMIYAGYVVYKKFIQ
jgi:hypothetical protein